jgi:hypothetical protein
MKDMTLSPTPVINFISFFLHTKYTAVAAFVGGFSLLKGQDLPLYISFNETCWPHCPLKKNLQSQNFRKIVAA